MKHAPLAALPVAAMLVVAGVYGAVESRRSEAPVAEAQSRARQAAQQAVPQTIFVKPWDKYIECGVQQRDLRECRREYWPGQVYPDEAIPGEREPGLVWRCESERRDRGSPPQKVCYADASDARKRAYPCPQTVTGPRLSMDEPVCASAKSVRNGGKA